MDIRSKILWWAVKRRVARDGCKVIAVGGAIAKTSTKTAIGTLLKLEFPGDVRVGYGNLNSYLGVPLSVLGFQIDFYERPIRLGWVVILFKAVWRGLFVRLPRYLVLEYGTDHPGDIAAIVAQLPPDVGVITIVGPAHLANYPSVDEMVKDEGFIAAGTKPDGLLLVNSSDSYLTNHHQRAKAKVINVVCSLEEIAIKFMEAFGRTLKISPEIIQEAKDDFVSPARRFEYQHIGPFQVIDDSYNASPLAVKAALHLLKQMPAPRIAILGAMRELGSTSVALHQEVGLYAKDYADTIIGVGEEAQAYNADFWFETADEAAEKILSHLPDRGSMLIKGSKSVHMEKVTEAIRRHYQPNNHQQ